jgi:hypothetical protein
MRLPSVPAAAWRPLGRGFQPAEFGVEAEPSILFAFGAGIARTLKDGIAQHGVVAQRQ